MKKQDRIFFLFGILMFLSELWKQWCLTYIVNSGTYDWWYFPFQLCSIPMYICLFLPFAKHAGLHRAMIAFLKDFGLLGGIFAFFDTSGMHYAYAPLTIHSFAWHFVLITIGIMAGLYYRDSGFKEYRGGLYIYLLCCLAATGFNLVFYRFGAINMFFISPHFAMSQKVFRDIASFLGNTAGIISYIGATILGASIFHYLWMKADSR